MVPAPPQVASQRPKAFLRGSDEAIQRPRFAHHRRDLGRRLGQHVNLIFAESPRLYGLNYQNALQNPPVDQWNPEKRLVGIFAGLPEVLETRMTLRQPHSYGTHLFRHQARQSFVDCHSQIADTLPPKAHGCGQHQIGPIRLEQICGTDISLKSLGNQGDDIHQGLGGLALLPREVGDLLQSEDVRDLAHVAGHVQLLNFVVIFFQSQAFWFHFIRILRV